MHWTFYKRLIAGLVMLMLLAPAGAGADDDIRWHPYQSGIALGKAEQKKVLINFYADWCRYCRQMDETTFRNPEVVSYLNRHFIAIKVNADREREISARFKIRPLPDTWFITAAGEKIGNKPGYVSAREFLDILKYVGTDSYLTMSFAKFRESL